VLSSTRLLHPAERGATAYRDSLWGAKSGRMA